ncbi:MAG TPA: Rv2175c family DNA-binding protein [Micromonosporaceae bacterium]
MTETQPADRSASWLSLADVAERLDVPLTRVRQMIRDGCLLGVKRNGVTQVPGELVANDNVLKHLPGVLTLLRDAGYTDEEVLGWLYAEDESLPGAPAQALAGPQATEVKRRAQALGF